MMKRYRKIAALIATVAFLTEPSYVLAEEGAQAVQESAAANAVTPKLLYTYKSTALQLLIMKW